MSPLTTALLSSGVIAAVILGIFNIIKICSNSRQLKQLELMKNKMGLMKFRYESLYNLSAELNSLPGVYYDFMKKVDNGDKIIFDKTKLGKITTEQGEYLSCVKRIMNRAIPLCDQNLLSEYFRLLDQEKKVVSQLEHVLYENDTVTEEEGALLLEVLTTRESLAKESLKCINEQLAKLLE